MRFGMKRPVPVVYAIRQVTSMNAAAANPTRRLTLEVGLTPERERTPAGEPGVIVRATVHSTCRPC